MSSWKDLRLMIALLKVREGASAMQIRAFQIYKTDRAEAQGVRRFPPSVRLEALEEGEGGCTALLIRNYRAGRTHCFLNIVNLH